MKIYQFEHTLEYVDTGLRFMFLICHDENRASSKTKGREHIDTWTPCQWILNDPYILSDFKYED